MTTDVHRCHGEPGKLQAVAIKPSGKRLRQGRSTGKPTVAQAARFEHIRAIGCIACLLTGWFSIDPEVHHLNQGGYHGAKRRGHDFTIGLCTWHHQGTCQDFSKADEARFVLGPSYKLHKMAFRARYGTDEQLLETTNKLIALRELALAEASVG
jgi:hypothetical protein